MEEDIKILEEFIKYFEAEAVSRKYRRNISITVGEDDIQALQNLIKGYRELEKRSTATLMYIDNKCIRKSKIKEKIEELLKKLDEQNKHIQF